MQLELMTCGFDLGDGFRKVPNVNGNPKKCEIEKCNNLKWAYLKEDELKV